MSVCDNRPKTNTNVLREQGYKFATITPEPTHMIRTRRGYWIRKDVKRRRTCWTAKQYAQRDRNCLNQING